MKLLTEPLRLWAVLAGLVGLAIALTLLGERTPAPRPASAPATEFSAERAMPVLRGLTDLGIRLSGTANERTAAEQLAAELRKLPGVEVEIQEAAATRQYTNTPYPYPLLVYRTLNVLARLPGRTRDAVLLDAHFDTTGTSVGAGDDAYGVAAIVETMRALSAEGPRQRSVVALLNGGEEYGLRGADGFTHHPWAADVRAYVYLDGCGAGKPRLINVTKGHPELLDAYARAVARPSANILMQDILDGFDLGADGDHRPLQDAGLAGLSLASIDDLAAAHTTLDRLERVSVSSLQQMGDTTLALTRALADAPPAAPIEGPRAVYFDVLGQTLVSYSSSTAALLAVAGLAAAGAALWLAVKGGRVTLRRLLLGLAWTALAQLAGLFGALLAALLLAFVLRRPQGWYSANWLAGVAFPGAALAAVLAIHALWRRRLRDDEAAPWVAWAACVAGWALWLLLATVKQAGAGYLALLWTLALSLGLLAALRWPQRMRAIFLASLLPGLVMTANLALPTLGALVPQTGAMVLPIPSDPLVAMLVTLPVLMAVAGAAVAAHMAGRPGRAALGALAIAAVGIVAVAAQAPFQAGSPRRLFATHIEDGGNSAIALSAFDVLPLEPDLKAVPSVTAARPDWHPQQPFFPDPTHELPAPPPPLALPKAEVLGSTPEADGTRTVQVRVTTSTPHLYVQIPRSRLAGWSFTPALPVEPAGGERDVILFIGLRPEGETFTLRVRGAEPLEIELRASAPLPGEALDALLEQLPAHIVFWPEMARVTRASL